MSIYMCICCVFSRSWPMERVTSKNMPRYTTSYNSCYHSLMNEVFHKL